MSELTRVSNIAGPLEIPKAWQHGRARVVPRDDLSGQTDVSFMHSVLAQVSLPRRRVMADHFERHSGRASVLLQAGSLWNGQQFEPQMLPYGPMPRLIIAWMSTYAVRHRTREIPAGRSATEFLEILGYNVGGGKRGTYTTFRRQMKALAAVKLTLGFGISTVNGTMVERFDAWLVRGETSALWPKQLLLDERFYASLIDRAVPLSNMALRALRGSSLALDVYAWLAHRLCRVQDQRGDMVNWMRLKEQFGHEYADTVQGRKDFKREFDSALANALRFYPNAKVESFFRRGQNIGKLLRPSLPPVARE